MRSGVREIEIAWNIGFTKPVILPRIRKGIVRIVVIIGWEVIAWISSSVVRVNFRISLS